LVFSEELRWWAELKEVCDNANTLLIIW